MARNTGRLASGILVGGLLAVGASIASREIMRRAGTRLIDWEQVREIAHRRLGEAAAPLSARHRSEAEAFYRSTLLRIEPIVWPSVIVVPNLKRTASHRYSKYCTSSGRSVPS